LCRQAGLKKSWTVKFPLRLATEFGMSWDTARRGLAELEAAGLVRITVRPGKALEVILIGAEPQYQDATPVGNN
jgi:hypothetical protein